MKKVTLQTIADELGVSKGLVSLALSNDPNVNDVTREAIWKKAEELGYRMKGSRKSTIATRTGCIAVLMPRAYLEDIEYWGKVIRGIDKELSKHHISMILSGLEIALPPKEGLPAALEDKVDGAIVMGHLPESYIQTIQSRKIPFVLVDANVFDYKNDHVLAHNFLGAYEAANALLNAGHRALGFVGDTGSAWSFRERKRGFDEAVAQFNAKTSPNDPVSTVTIEGLGVSGKGNYRSEEFAKSLQKALTSDIPATALFCANDVMAFEVLKLIKTWGMNCPNDVSVIGFDDLALTEFMQPKLSTVRVRKNTIGARAAELILRRMAKPSAAPEHVLIATELIERDSVLHVNHNVNAVKS